MINSFWDLKNADDLEDELVEMLIDFDVYRNNYESDIYLYVDEDTMTGKLDIFPNPGGNSWLNDDHYFLYTDKQHYEDWSDSFQTIEDIAYGINMSYDSLVGEVVDYLNEELDDVDEFYDESDIGMDDVIRYVDENYLSEIESAYEDLIRSGDFRSDYVDKAVEIIDVFDADLKEEREERNRKW